MGGAANSTVDTLIVALLGAGGATFLWTVVRSYLAVRNSAEVREDKAIARLERYEGDCRHELAFERRVSGYWREATFACEAKMVMGGMEPPHRETPPTFTPRSE